jgi:hypothetical protein
MRPLVIPSFRRSIGSPTRTDRRRPTPPPGSEGLPLSPIDPILAAAASGCANRSHSGYNEKNSVTRFADALADESPRNAKPHVGKRGVQLKGVPKVAARRSAKDNNQKQRSELFLIIADRQRLSRPPAGLVGLNLRGHAMKVRFGRPRRRVFARVPLCRPPSGGPPSRPPV